MRVAASLVAVLACLLFASGEAQAAGESRHGEAETTVSVDGSNDFSNPPSAEPGYCDGNGEFPFHVSERTAFVRSDTNVVRIERSDGSQIDLASVFSEIPNLDGATTFEIESVYWKSACTKTSAGVQIDGDTLEFTWIRVPTPESIVPGLLEQVLASLNPPDVSFPDADREFGWLYVNAPMDFRIEPIDTVRRERTVTNVTGSATGWVEATPDYIVFDPGEPDVRPIVCGYTDAIAPYDIDNPGACSHRYSNSSAITATGTFRATHAVVWDITSSAPLTINQPVSSLSQDIEVAEIQAIENR